MNYKQQSADGISLAFLVVWLIGDMSNLSGGFPIASLPNMTSRAASPFPHSIIFNGVNSD